MAWFYEIRNPNNTLLKRDGDFATQDAANARGGSSKTPTIYPENFCTSPENSAARYKDNRKPATLPMYYGARGKFSEIDTEGFAITILREYRRKR